MGVSSFFRMGFHAMMTSFALKMTPAKRETAQVPPFNVKNFSARHLLGVLPIAVSAPTSQNQTDLIVMTTVFAHFKTPVTMASALDSQRSSVMTEMPVR